MVCAYKTSKKLEEIVERTRPTFVAKSCGKHFPDICLATEAEKSTKAVNSQRADGVIRCEQEPVMVGYVCRKNSQEPIIKYTNRGKEKVPNGNEFQTLTGNGFVGSQLAAEPARATLFRDDFIVTVKGKMGAASLLIKAKQKGQAEKRLGVMYINEADDYGESNFLYTTLKAVV